MDVNLDPVQELATLTENMNRLTALLEELEKNIETKEESVPEVLETDKITLGSYELETYVSNLGEKLSQELLNITPIKTINDTPLGGGSSVDVSEETDGEDSCADSLVEQAEESVKDSVDSKEDSLEESEKELEEGWLYTRCIIV